MYKIIFKNSLISIPLYIATNIPIKNTVISRGYDINCQCINNNCQCGVNNCQLVLKSLR